ncbi:MAG: aspartate-semialdehyde dehydrogenase [Chlamydiae bacterium]|nr:aspartate-semialdehyde dehydrogenase [Chlamydiota bacterium]
MKRSNIGIIGATGAVGQEILALLEKRDFPLDTIKLFASPSSLGITKRFKNREISVEILNNNSFDELDIAFFSAGGSISKKYVPIAQRCGCTVIDNSSAFRMNPSVPLIIPEINSPDMKMHQGIIANPNCATIIMLMALAPLHKIARIKRIVVSTYQAASGAGARAMEDLLEETRSHFTNALYERKVIPFPYAFNLFLHNSARYDNDYCEEELKMIYETHKILKDENIRINATCVRVPVLRAHSESINVEFYDPIDTATAYQILQESPGIKIVEDRTSNRFPMPSDAVGQDEVICGRIRQDLSQKNTLDIWVVADQLLKGAALNAVQIAEILIQQPLKQVFCDQNI